MTQKNKRFKRFMNVSIFSLLTGVILAIAQAPIWWQAERDPSYLSAAITMIAIAATLIVFGMVGLLWGAARTEIKARERDRADE